MRKGLLLAIAGLFVVFTVPLGAATLIPVAPVSGSVETDVYGINDDNILVGTYFTEDSAEHGFFGTSDGSYTTFDVGDAGTQGRAINNIGTITGFANANGRVHCNFKEFERDADGSVKMLSHDHHALKGIVQGINDKGFYVGEDCQSDGSIQGYEGKAGKYKSQITLPFDAVWVGPRGLNRNGDIVGFYFDSEGVAHGFAIQQGVATSVDYPDGSVLDTYFEGINDKGMIAGVWDDADGNNHGFAFDSATDTFTEIDVPDATFVQATGVNRAGLISVLSDVGSFIYCPLARRKCPGGGGAVVTNRNHRQAIHVAP